MASLKFFEVARELGTICFGATVIFNSCVIYLTSFHTKRIVGTYKHMIIIFAFFGLLFSFMELLVHPFFHSFNGSFAYFSIEKCFGASWEIRSILLAIYSGVYSTVISFMAVQFMFRYLTLINDPKISYFQGWKLLYWVGYALFFGTLWGSFAHYFGYPDEYSQSYLREVMFDNYNADIEDIPGYLIVAFHPRINDNSPKFVRWMNFTCISGLITILVIQYCIVIFCGVQIYLNMHERMKQYSATHRRLHEQFFRALVYQISAPSLTVHFPIVPVLCAPFFDLKMNLPSGLIVTSFSTYPPIDSLILMLVVSEYREAFRKLSKKYLPQPKVIMNNSERMFQIIIPHKNVGENHRENNADPTDFSDVVISATNNTRNEQSFFVPG